MKETEISRFLFKVSKLGTGDLVALKRSAGKEYYQVNGKALAAFGKVVGEEVKYNEEYIWFNIAALYALFECKNGTKSLAECLRMLGGTGVEKRVINILDDELSEDSLMLSNLTRLVKMLHREGIVPDFERLLKDLLMWNRDDKLIQRQWAIAYFANTQE